MVGANVRRKSRQAGERGVQAGGVVFHLQLVGDSEGAAPNPFGAARLPLEARELAFVQRRQRPTDREDARELAHAHLRLLRARAADAASAWPKPRQQRVGDFGQGAIGVGRAELQRRRLRARQQLPGARLDLVDPAMAEHRQRAHGLGDKHRLHLTDPSEYDAALAEMRLGGDRVAGVKRQPPE